MKAKAKAGCDEISQSLPLGPAISPTTPTQLLPPAQTRTTPPPYECASARSHPRCNPRDRSMGVRLVIHTTGLRGSRVVRAGVCARASPIKPRARSRVRASSAHMIRKSVPRSGVRAPKSGMCGALETAAPPNQVAGCAGRGSCCACARRQCARGHPLRNGYGRRK